MGMKRMRRRQRGGSSRASWSGAMSAARNTQPSGINLSPRSPRNSSKNAGGLTTVRRARMHNEAALVGEVVRLKSNSIQNLRLSHLVLQYSIQTLPFSHLVNQVLVYMLGQLRSHSMQATAESSRLQHLLEEVETKYAAEVDTTTQ